MRYGLGIKHEERFYKLNKLSHERLEAYLIAEKEKEDSESHKIDKLYNFRMIQAVIKCFEKSSIERIEENSKDVSRGLFIR